MQAAKLAVRDIYDAIVELVTNADDRYQRLNCDGTIEVVIERRRGVASSVLRVRDNADGMDSKTMERKLSHVGRRESGLAEGQDVRGTHSRGAKDIAALGHVTFESIAATDGMYHKCEITPHFEFIEHDPQPASSKVRQSLGIPSGSGTLVSIELDANQRVPQHENLKDQIQRLVPLQGVLRDPRRSVKLIDLGRHREDPLKAPWVDRTERIKEQLEIPGYPNATAKLFIYRAKERFERERDRFRLGGIQIESKRAIHEATLFDPGLESDASALWFFGRLVCPYIDDLCNEYDDRFEAHETHSKLNPTYPLDPSRRSGLNREHPFVQALFGEALKRLRPLVEEERKREEHQKAQIESEATRKRLNALERAVQDFMRDYQDEETARDPEGTHPESRFVERGYALSPPFTQMIVGHSQQFWLSVRQETFPELEVGSGVQIECLSEDIVSDKRFCGLEKHPTREGVLRAIWKVKAQSATAASGVRVRVGSITAESMVEVLASEADRYKDVGTLQFESKRYRVRVDQKQKKIRLLAPIALAPVPTAVTIAVSSPHFLLSGQSVLLPHQALNVALCDFYVKSDGKDAAASLVARLGNSEASATIATAPPLSGVELKIKLEDIDHGNQRYRWRQNVLEIAARHPSLRRYLGDSQKGFPGQELAHFRVLLAEVVADAVCQRLVGQIVRASPEDFENADWDEYYAIYSKYMTAFLPKAHKLQFPEPQL